MDVKNSGKIIKDQGFSIIFYFNQIGPKIKKCIICLKWFTMHEQLQKD
jgi:hypothetical protein